MTEKKVLKVAKPVLAKKSPLISKREIKRRVREDNWIFLLSGYLHLARIGCEHFLTLEKKKEFQRNIILASIFNIKHSLEATIKFLSLITNPDGSKANDYNETHNLGTLIRSLKAACPKMRPDDEQEFKQLFSDFENVAEKYFSLDIIHRHINGPEDFFIEDPENTFLRYPERTGVDILMRYGAVLGRFTDEDVREIINDTHELERTGVKLSNLLEKYFTKKPI
jgi:hypothetical protein